MSHYRRASIEGGLFFFTVTLADRSSESREARPGEECVRLAVRSFRNYVARGDLPADWGGDIGEISGSFGE
jgi:hypothetical protein